MNSNNHIIHIDIDAFFASVEELDNPDLIGKPVVVGGRSSRGIITTANYEARKYGLHSAMPIFIAKNLCPDLIVVPARHSRYVEKSKEVFNLLYNFTDNIEQVSIDECYIDVENLGDPVEISKEIKKEIKSKTGLTVSCGVSYNKFLAKLASDWNKPDGLKIISENEVPEILFPLDIKKIHGLGSKSQRKLRSLGINTVEDMYQLDLKLIQTYFGKMGYEIYQRIRGIDKRTVNTHRIRKSIGIERTFPETRDKEILLYKLLNFIDELSNDLLKRNIGFKTITIKYKTFDFKLSTHSKTFNDAIYKKDDVEKYFVDLFNCTYKGEKLRLLGISVSNLSDLNLQQLNFFDS